MAEDSKLKHWWVNQTRAVARGMMLDYLWAPEAVRGSAAESARLLQEVRPGDLLFAYSDGAIGGIGLVLRAALAAARPAELSAGKPARTPGWYLPVRFFELALPLHLKSHMTALKPLLPAQHAPLRSTGIRNPAVYLAEVPAALASALRALLAGQLEDVEAQIKAAVESELADDWMESSIRRRSDLAPQEKLQLVRARRGLGSFRASLEKLENACRVTGLLDRRHLRACHIKPWSVSEDREKLDGANGLLLSPHVAHLFLRGYISFSNDGDLLASRHLNPAILTAWSVRMPMKTGPFRPVQWPYLDYHRQHIFDRPGIGRIDRTAG
jgi:hypothetical protein